MSIWATESIQFYYRSNKLGEYSKALQIYYFNNELLDTRKRWWYFLLKFVLIQRRLSSSIPSTDIQCVQVSSR